MYFCKILFFLNREISERGFNNPHPCRTTEWKTHPGAFPFKCCVIINSLIPEKCVSDFKFQYSNVHIWIIKRWNVYYKSNLIWMPKNVTDNFLVNFGSGNDQEVLISSQLISSPWELLVHNDIFHSFWVVHITCFRQNWSHCCVIIVTSSYRLII